MLLGGPGPDGSDPGFKTQGAIFYEVRSVGQKSNGMLEQLFVRPTMAVLSAAADGTLYDHPGTGWDDDPLRRRGALRRRPRVDPQAETSRPSERAEASPALSAFVVPTRGPPPPPLAVI